MNIGFFAGHSHYIPHARLLIDSLHRTFKSAKIGLVVPENSFKAFEHALSHTGVSIIICPQVESIPFHDKLIAASIYEKTLTGAFLWVDIDSYFINPFEGNDTYAIQVNPVDMKNIGITYGEAFSEVWLALFETFHTKFPEKWRSVTTSISKEVIYPYYNMGCVHIKDNRGVFTKARRALEDVLSSTPSFLQVPLNQIFIHQAAFTCALLETYEAYEIGHLPLGMNLPLHLRHHAEDFPSPTEWLSIRYDTAFSTQESIEDLPEALKNNRDHLSMLWYYTA